MYVCMYLYLCVYVCMYVCMSHPSVFLCMYRGRIGFGEWVGVDVTDEIYEGMYVYMLMIPLCLSH